MHDMNAFEQQVANEVVGAVRPPRAVDVTAVVRAATADSSRDFHSLFNATAFVLAGIVVALFGGVLLVGMLSQPQDTTPQIGVPATESASPSAEIDIPGLTFESVRPGIERVVSDDTGRSFDDVRHVATGPDGTTWLATTDGAVYALGDPGATRVAGDHLSEVSELVVLSDGTPLAYDAEGGAIATWDGERWSAMTPDLGSDWSLSNSFARSSDGALWAVAWRGPEGDDGPGHGALVRIEAEGTTLYPIDELGVEGVAAVASSLATTPEGTLWAGLTNFGYGTPTIGLLTLDGDTWRAVAPFGEGVPFATDHLVVGPDGVLHAAFEQESGWYVGRWDGTEWTIARDPVTRDGLRAEVDRAVAAILWERPWIAPFGADRGLVDGAGRRWSLRDGLAVLEGASLVDYVFPGPFATTDPVELALDREGRVWVVLATEPGPSQPERGPAAGLYMIDPEVASASTPEYQTAGRDGVVLLMHPKFATRGLGGPDGDQSETARWAVSEGTGIIARVVGAGGLWEAQLDSVGVDSDRWVKRNATGWGDDPVSAIEAALQKEPAIDFAHEAALSAVLEWPPSSPSP